MSFLSNLISAGLVYLTGGAYAGYLAAATFAAGTYADMDARRRARNARADYNRSLQDRYQMLKTATAARAVVYGRARVSGPILFAHSTGDKQQFLHLVVALAGHEIDAIEGVYLNDTLLPAPNATTGFIESGDFATIRKDVRSITGGASSVTIPLAAGETLVRVVSVTQGWQYGGQQQTRPAPFTVAGLVVSYSPSSSPGSSYTSTGYTVAYEVNVVVPRVRVRHHLGGTAGTQPFPELVTESAGKWGSTTHLCKGLAAVYVRLEFDQDLFGQIGLPSVSAVVRGRKVYDPRLDSTAGGTGTQRLATPSTWTWSDNAALCIADYLRDATYGLGATGAEIPAAELIAEANIADQLVTLTAGGATQKRYTVNGTISSDGSRQTNLEALVQAGAGSVVWTQGRWRLRVGAHRTAVLTITEDMLAGAPTIQPWAARRDQINKVVATYSAADAKYTEVQAPAVANATYLADDGGIELVSETTCTMCIDAMRAQRLAKIQLERARQAMIVRLRTNLRAYDLSPGDIVALSLSRYGFSAKIFEVVERELDPDAWTIGLTLRETASAVWDWNFGEATAVDLTPNTTLPSPFAPPASITGLTAASGSAHLQLALDGTIVTRARLTWTQSTDAMVVQGGRIEVQWRDATVDAWQAAASTLGDETGAYIGPLQDGRVILVRVRPVNSLRRAGAWTTIEHTVVGKTEPPAAPDRFTVVEQPNAARAFFWDLTAPPLDLSGFLVRYSEGTTVRPWESMVPLLEASRDERSRIISSPGDGEFWLAIKSVDTSGNQSASATFLQAVFDAAGFGAAFLTVDPAALAWPGTKTSAAIDGYALVDIGVSTWDALPLTWDTWTAWTTGSSGVISYEHPVIDALTSASTRIRVSEVAGGSAVSEYQSSVDGVTYTAWAAVPTGPVTARFFKVRWTVSGAAPILYRASVTLYR